MILLFLVVIKDSLRVEYFSNWVQNMDQISMASQSEQRAKQVRFAAFFGDVKQEFRKIDWTTRKELISYTKVVFGAIFIGGFALYLMDLFVHSALWAIGALVRGMGG
jgi:preprotein translocase subunit SecE